MKLLDRISLERSIKMLLDFIVTVIKLFVPSKDGDKPNKPRFPRWRVKND